MLGFLLKQRVTTGVATTNESESTMTKTTDQLIQALQPGHEVQISEAGETRVTVERTGDGLWLRFVRHTHNGFQVFRTSRV